MKLTLATVFAAFASAASAHTGHIAPVAGHGHAEILGAIALAAVAGAVLWVRSRQ